MAKVAKPKRDPLSKAFLPAGDPALTTADNPRSRAARRATSPSLNTDKSITDAPRASDATPVLKPYHGAGIQKKTKKKQLSHAQRMRHEKGLARAEAVQAQLEVKVEEAKSRLKKRQSRRALWDDVNGASKEETRKAIKAPGRFGALDDEDDMKDNIEPFYGDTEIKVIGGVQVPAFATGEAMNVAMGPGFTTSTKKPGTFGVQSKQPGPAAVEGEQPDPAVEVKEPEAVDEIT